MKPGFIRHFLIPSCTLVSGFAVGVCVPNIDRKRTARDIVSGIRSRIPDRNNRNEEDRIPNLRRCERILWIQWVIQNAGNDGFPWWENQRQGNTHVVIWAQEHDFAIVLAKRRDYYVLKTAYAEIKPHRRKTFRRNR